MEFRILDVSIRDSYAFSKRSINLKEIELLIQTLLNMNIEHIEVGYYNAVKYNNSHNLILNGSDEYFNFLDSLYVIDPRLKFYLMLHPDECQDLNELNRLNCKQIYSIRIIYKKKYEDLIKKQVEVIKSFGKQVCINLTRITEKNKDDIYNFMKFCHEIKPDIIYFADSNSALYPNDVAQLFLDLKKEYQNIEFGFHAHNGMHCALLNSIESIKNGACIIDTSLLPFGRVGKQNLNIFYFFMYSLKNKMINVDKNEMLQSIKNINNKFNIDTDYVSFLEGLLNLNIDIIQEYNNKNNNEQLLEMLINKL